MVFETDPLLILPAFGMYSMLWFWRLAHVFLDEKRERKKERKKERNKERKMHTKIEKEKMGQKKRDEDLKLGEREHPSKTDRKEEKYVSQLTILSLSQG